jgi:hypothetical protein
MGRPERAARLKALCASLALLFFGYMGMSVLTDRSRLQQELVDRMAALESAQATIQELQSHTTGTSTLSRQFYAERRTRHRQEHHATGTDEGQEATVAPAVVMSDHDKHILRAAAVINSPTCKANWLAEQRAAVSLPPSPYGTPLPYAGGDLEMPGVMEAALAARAPDRELIFLSVGDTRDHRRQYKDPSLRTISIDFLRNLLANLKRLRLNHYLILTTESLCRRLQQDFCEYSCVWTSLWHSHPGLPKWNLKPGDVC